MSRFLYLIPLLPLVGFVLNFALGVRMMRRRLGLPGPGLGRWPAPGGHADGAGDHGAGVPPGHDVHAADAHVHADPSLHAGITRLRPAGARTTATAHAAHAHPPAIIGIIACGTVLLSFLLSVYAVFAAHHAPGHTLVETLWTWVPGGAAETVAGARPFIVDWAYQVDPLSSVMLLVVTFVGFWIHVYSTGYMSHDPGYARYMSYLNLFMFAMLTLVLGANYLMLFVGWEGVGLCSYLLIGFWFDRKSASDAGKKAFIVNRIGDAGFVARHVPDLHHLRHRWTSATVTQAAAAMPVEWAWSGPLTMIGAVPVRRRLRQERADPALRLAAGRDGRPDARSRRSSTPRPWSPRASTWSRAPPPSTPTRPRRCWWWRWSAPSPRSWPRRIGLVQNDIKRVLAYSTVSQLGYMFLACGVGAFGGRRLPPDDARLLQGPALPRLRLGHPRHVRRAGHAADGRPQVRSMPVDAPHDADRLHRHRRASRPWPASSPRTRSSGRPSRSAATGACVWAIGFVVAGLTAFYMFRLYHMTFSGEFRGTARAGAPRARVAGVDDRAPAGAGRGLGRSAGLLGDPARDRPSLHIPNVFEHFLEPVFAARAGRRWPRCFSTPRRARRWSSCSWLLSVAVAVLGIFVAKRFFERRGAGPDPHRRRMPRPLPPALQQVLRGRALRPRVREGRGHRRRQRAARRRPLRDRRRGRGRAARPRRERPRLGDARRRGRRSPTPGTATWWTAP